MKRILSAILILVSISISAQTKIDSTTTARVLQIKLNEEVSPAMWLKVQRGFEKAQQDSFNLILLHINTYGGTVLDADSIRTCILNCKIPVFAFIDNNAASAGALIAIACDSIYMRRGANIGAATVVNQSGAAMPDKYQSYMRAIMRSTAEAHGYDTIINGNDTLYKWHRNPQIAEAMVDEKISITNISDSGKVLTFTSLEAVKYGFCEGIAENIDELLAQTEFKQAKVTEYQPTKIENLLGWLMNPALQSLLIMAIIGGIYFEMQSPGIGFPSIIAITAAVLYFAPLYLEGLAAHWEIAIFVIGLILIIIEIFAIPGFGVCGISGIILAVSGLALAMLGNFNSNTPNIQADDVVKSFLLVMISSGVSIAGCIWITSKFYGASLFGNRLALTATQQTDDGFIGVKQNLEKYIGQKGVTTTVLRPSGKITIDGHEFDAKSNLGFIDKNKVVKIVGCSTGQLYVEINK